MSGELVVELVGVVLAPLIIGLFFLAFDRRRERTRETTEMFVRYNSKLVLESRAKAWAFLTSTYASNPQPWSIFYSDLRATDVDRGPFWEAHDSLVIVAAEWALLGVLLEEERVSETLARRLFSNQYRAWSVAFRQIRDVTMAAGEVPPSWSDLLPTLDEKLLEPGEPRPGVLEPTDDITDTSPVSGSRSTDAS